MVLVFLAAATCKRRAVDESGPPGPSVLLVTMDTTRADALGCYGGPARTPVLDGVAARGTLFDEAITTVPVTLPAHASILTGTYPPFHGARHNGAFALPQDSVTLAEHFTERGYETSAVIGAAVLDSVFGVDQGFGRYEDFYSGKRPDGGDGPAERRAAEVSRLACELIEEAGDSPLFLWVHYYDPHDPYEPPPSFEARDGEHPYHAEIGYMDAQLSTLLESFRAHAAARELPPLIVLTADHGEGLGDHGEATHGLTLYEEAVRVPLIIEMAGTVPERQRIADPVGLIDLAPTVLELAGIETAADVVFHGRSRVDLLTAPVRPAADLARPAADSAAAGDSRLTAHGDPLVSYVETAYPQLGYGWSDLRGLRTHRYKFIDGPAPELYDLRADPGERRNLLEGTRRIIDPEAALRDRLDDLLERVTSSHPYAQLPMGIARDVAPRLESLGYVRAVDNPDAGDPDVVRADHTQIISSPDKLGNRTRSRRARMPLPRDSKDMLAVHAVLPPIEAALEFGEFSSALEKIDAIAVSGAPPLILLHLEAEARTGLGQSRKAAELYRRILGCNGRDAVAAVQLAALLAGDAHGDGREGEVDDLLELALRFARGAHVVAAVGDVTVMRGDPRAALAHFDRAAAMPDGASARLELGRARALLALGRHDEARELLLSAVTRSPRAREARLLLAEAQIAVGRPQEAVLHLQSLVAPRIGDIDALALSAVAMLDLRRLDMAEQFVEAIEERRPDDPRAQLLRIRVQLAGERYREADMAIEAAIAELGELPELLLARAETRLVPTLPGHDAAVALDLARRAGLEMPGSWRAPLIEARALLRLDRPAEAIAVLQRALDGRTANRQPLQALLERIDGGE